jgi:heme/copper-type cytochrome/quinol oxidase subunit 2
MRLDTQREAATAKRKGMMVRTVIGTIWLGINFAVAYFLISYLFENGDLNQAFFWNQLYIPRQVGFDGLKILISIVIVVIMNFFVLLGFGFSSSTGRIRPGTPSMVSRNPDPNDKKYDY